MYVILSASMTQRSTRQTLDQALDGKVTQLLKRRRDEGRSASEIRDELRDDHRITVSERTVRRWLTEIDEAA